MKDARKGPTLPLWAGMAMGLEKAWEQVRTGVLEQEVLRR